MLLRLRTPTVHAAGRVSIHREINELAEFVKATISSICSSTSRRVSPSARQPINMFSRPESRGRNAAATLSNRGRIALESSRSRWLKTGHCVEQRGLSRSVRSDDPESRQR